MLVRPTWEAVRELGGVLRGELYLKVFKMLKSSC